MVSSLKLCFIGPLRTHILFRRALRCCPGFLAASTRRLHYVDSGRGGDRCRSGTNFRHAYSGSRGGSHTGAGVPNHCKTRARRFPCRFMEFVKHTSSVEAARVRQACRQCVQAARDRLLSLEGSPEGDEASLSLAQLCIFGSQKEQAEAVERLTRLQHKGVSTQDAPSRTHPARPHCTECTSFPVACCMLVHFSPRRSLSCLHVQVYAPPTSPGGLRSPTTNAAACDRVASSSPHWPSWNPATGMQKVS